MDVEQEVTLDEFVICGVIVSESWMEFWRGGVKRGKELGGGLSGRKLGLSTR